MPNSYRVTVAAGNVALVLPRGQALHLRELLTNIRRGKLKSRDKENQEHNQLIAGIILLAMIDSINWEQVQ